MRRLESWKKGSRTNKGSFHCSFQLLADGSAQLILAAAGGGGASDQVPGSADASSSSGAPDARGLLPPSLPLRDLLRLVPRGDDDAGEWRSLARAAAVEVRGHAIFPERILL